MKYILNLSDLKIGPLKLWHWLMIIVVLGGISLSFYLQNYSFVQQKIKELASREVKNYQGENLSSINDLQENSIVGTQNIDIANYSLEITGLVASPKKYSYEQVLSFDKYSKVVELNCVTGWSAKILWEGVLLKDLLNSAQVKAQSKVAIFYAKDGFSTSLPLDYIFSNDIFWPIKPTMSFYLQKKDFPSSWSRSKNGVTNG